jgi:hypothetical protein
MQMRTKSFLSVVLFFLVVAGTRSLQAQARETDRDMTPETASKLSKDYVAPFGVPLAPPIYLINFLLLYFSNPETAAYMPAYRVALPQEVYKCLVENPGGCPYAEIAPFFAQQAADTGGGRNQKTFWPESCRTSPRLEDLAPTEDRRADQINEPLGRKRADQLAQLLGMTPDVILTNEEYQCLIGTPPRNQDQETIYSCSIDLTNSRGNTDIPLSSWGLYQTSNGDVRSDCAPQAPCLEFNKLFAGPLEKIAKQCGFANKLAHLVAETPFLQFVAQGHRCQQAWMPTSCIAEAPCARKGGQSGQSNDKCGPSLLP